MTRLVRAGWGAAALAALAALGGCVGAAADHETLGDRAYAQGQYADALVEYRLALGRGSSAELRWKAGEAALDAGDLAAAAEEFKAMAREGGRGREGTAADGLVRVADAALARHDQRALGAALDALEQVAPSRALGSFADQLAQMVGNAPGGASQLALLPYAAGGARDARAQDSIMYAYGVALQRADSCEAALTVFESLVRRQRDPGVTAGARAGLVGCALEMGRRALDANTPTVAEQWYRQAITLGEAGPGVRLAYVGLGDIRFAMGDLVAAIDAYEQARAGLAPGDSIYAIVSDKLRLIARPVPDSQ